MTKKKRSLRRTLLNSIISLALCFSMLLGTTFAWFTDSVSSVNNLIQSGNLDMEVYWKPYGAEYTDWTEVDKNVQILGKDALYEPGYTEAIWLKVENAGSLAFRYALSLYIASETEGVNMDSELFKLSDSLVVKSTPVSDLAGWEAFYQTRESLNNFAFTETPLSEGEVTLAGNNVLYSKDDEEMRDWSSGAILVVVQMPTAVGNEANHDGETIPKLVLGLTALATQVTYEDDTFGPDYDKDSEYPELIRVPANAIGVESFTELKNAVSVGGPISLKDNIAMEEKLTVSKETEIYGNEYELTYAANSTSDTMFAISGDGDLTLYEVNVDGGDEYSFDANGTIVYDAAKRNTSPAFTVGQGSNLKLSTGTDIKNIVAKGTAVITATGNATERATVTIENASIEMCAGESGTIINASSNTDVYIEDGAVIANNASYNNNNHGILKVYYGSIIHMNGGKLNNNYYSGNGMIGLYGSSKIIINGGELRNNSWFMDNQNENGWMPLIYAHESSCLEMNGGTISDNTVKYGVINSLNSELNGALTLNGGTITNNRATNNDDKDALATVYQKKRNELVISDQANATGTVYLYKYDDGTACRQYLTLEEYFAN